MDMVVTSVEIATDHNCDRCSARSKWLWEKDNLSLGFCAHHNAEFKLALDRSHWISTEKD